MKGFHVEVVGFEEEEDRKKKDDDSAAGGKILSLVFGVVFLPAAALAFVFYWGLLRYGRLKRSVILSVAVLLVLTSVVYGFLSDALLKVFYVVKNITDFSDNWGLLIPSVIVVNVIAGAVAGTVLCFVQTSRMKSNPHLVQLEGSWMHNFHFRPTPLENFKRKKKIKGLKEGVYNSDDKAPLGIDETEYDNLGLENHSDIVYRYNSDAVRQTLVSGTSGSGKALPLDTLVATPEGLQENKDLRIGSVILSPDGPCKVTGFSPVEDKKEYVVSVGGVEVPCSPDHLWQVWWNEKDYENFHYYVEKLKESRSLLLEGEWSEENIPQRYRYSLPFEVVVLVSCLSDERYSERFLSILKDRVLPGDNYSLSEINDLVSHVIENTVYDATEGAYDFAYLTRKKAAMLSVKIEDCVKRSCRNAGPSAVIQETGESLYSLRSVIEILCVMMVENFFSYRTYSVMTTEQIKNLVEHGTRLYVPGLYEKSNSEDALKKTAVLKRIDSVRDSGRTVPMRCIATDAKDHVFYVTDKYIVTHNTITLLSLMLNDIQAGIPLIVIDMKRDPKFATKLAQWSHENGREFYHFVNGDPEEYNIPYSQGQSRYDPLINGGASKPDMLLNMREYDTASDRYKNAKRQVLQVLFQMLRQADPRRAPMIDWSHGGIYNVASAVEKSNFTELAAACEGRPVQSAAEDMDNHMRSRGSVLREQMEELHGQMRTLIASEYGEWLRTVPGERNIDLYDLTKEGRDSVVLFSINSDSEKDFAQYLGSLIMSDLNAVSARRRNDAQRNQVHVYVDEFQVIPPSAVTGLLEKSRGSGIGMTISSQSYDQIIVSAGTNGEAYLGGIMDTCSNFIVHAGSTEDSAIRLSKILGKEMGTVYSSTNQNKSFFFSLNFANRRESLVRANREERWRFDPSEFMSLEIPVVTGRSTAVIVSKASSDPRFRGHKGAVAQKVWMVPNNKVLEEVHLSGWGEDEKTPVGTRQHHFDNSPQDDSSDMFYDSEPLGDEYNNGYDDFNMHGYDPAGTGIEADDGGFGWDEVPDDNGHVDEGFYEQPPSRQRSPRQRPSYGRPPLSSDMGDRLQPNPRERGGYPNGDPRSSGYPTRQNAQGPRGGGGRDGNLSPRQRQGFESTRSSGGTSPRRRSSLDESSFTKAVREDYRPERLKDIQGGKEKLSGRSPSNNRRPAPKRIPSPKTTENVKQEDFSLPDISDLF